MSDEKNVHIRINGPRAHTERWLWKDGKAVALKEGGGTHLVAVFLDQAHDMR